MGGAAVIEIKPSGSFWHAHLHMIIWSRWWYTRDLSNEWRRCAPGFIVYIENADGHDLQRYLTKYLSKGDVPEDVQREMSSALKGRRLLLTFGDTAKLERTLPKDKPFCPACGDSRFCLFDLINRFTTPTDQYGLAPPKTSSLKTTQELCQTAYTPDLF